MKNYFVAIIILIILFIILVACSPVSSTQDTNPTIPPTEIEAITPTLTQTIVNTNTPEPIATSTIEPTIAPEFVGEFRVENLVYTEFENPEAATWAILYQTGNGFDVNQLAGTTIDVIVNGVPHTLSGEQAVAQIQQMGGILVDYDEGQFISPDLNVGITVTKDGQQIYSNQGNSVPNWSEVGVVKMPLNCDTGESILNDPTVIVYHYDDMDPSDGLYSSIEGYTHPQSFTNKDTPQELWVPGVQQGHGNAIDIGRIPTINENAIQICAPKEYNITHIVPWERSNGTEMSMQIASDVSALVNFNGSYSTTPLHIGMNHVMSYDGELPLGQNSKGTPIGHMDSAGGKYPEIHLGIYGPNCYGTHSCDPSRPTGDPNALILPFRLFISSDVYKQILLLKDTSSMP